MKLSSMTLAALLCVSLLCACTQTEAPLDEVTRIESPFAAPNDGGEESTTDSTAADTTAEPETETVTEAVTEPEPEPEIPEEPTLTETARISFLAAGDNVIHKCIWRDAEIRAQQSGYFRDFDFKPTYEDTIDYIQSFDLAFINQETLLGGVELGLSSYPQFNSPQEVGLDLKEMGFDIVNIAHNHMADFGVEGLQRTINFFNSDAMDGVTMIGGYENAEDYDTIRTIECEGVTLSLLSYTYGTNESMPGSTELIVPRYKDADIIRQCALAEKAGDITVVSVHWGYENYTEPTDTQRRIAKLLADNGADVIIGHHPHVLQPIEWIETENGNKALCIYSLGNLISGMAEWENMVGGFATFDFVVYDDGSFEIENVKFVPTAFYFGPNHLGSKLFFLKDYTEEYAMKHGMINNYGEEYASPDKMIQFAEDIMGDYLKLEP